MLRLLQDDGTLWQQRAFSICTSPHEQSFLELAVKIYGPFTKRASSLKPGDHIEIAGPYGVFLYDHTFPHDIVMLSGGIGIAPFMSMLRQAAVTSAPHHITLLFHNRSEKDIPFLEELSQRYATSKNIHVHFFVDQGEPPIGGSVSLLSEDQLMAHQPDFSQGMFYLCGPSVFMEEAKTILLKHGVTNDRIKIERF